MNDYFKFFFIFVMVFCLIAGFMTIPEVFITKQNIDYMCNSIVRAVETTGEINADIEALICDIRSGTGLNPEILWEGNFVDNGLTRKIQIRQRFALTLTQSVRLRFATPMIGAPLVIDVPVKKKVHGVSEVYWKPGEI